MKNVRLHDVTSGDMFETSIRSALYQSLGIEGRYTLHNFSWPGWPVADFIQHTARNMALAAQERGRIICKQDFKNFKEEKTFLQPEQVEAIWHYISNELFGGEIADSEANSLFEIPELEKSIKEADIEPVGRRLFFRSGDEGQNEKDKLERDRVRVILLERLTENLSINDRETLLSHARNRLFARFQDEFGLFDEIFIEPKTEISRA